jgi:hypothetical protein
LIVRTTGFSGLVRSGPGKRKLMTTVDLEIVKFSSIECRLQMSGELSVGWMVNGFIYAQNLSQVQKFPTVTDVLNLGRFIEPNKNALGFRTCGVQVGYDVKMNWEDVPRQVVNLCEEVENLTPNEFFYEYETVHPFIDGNGRTGVILFNWLNGTLDHPVWAKDFWNDRRRTVGYGA